MGVQRLVRSCESFSSNHSDRVGNRQLRQRAAIIEGLIFNARHSVGNDRATALEGGLLHTRHGVGNQQFSQGGASLKGTQFNRSDGGRDVQLCQAAAATKGKGRNASHRRVASRSRVQFDSHCVGDLHFHQCFAPRKGKISDPRCPTGDFHQAQVFSWFTTSGPLGRTFHRLHRREQHLHLQ